MNPTENVDQDAVLRARTVLLGSGRPDARQELEAYRVLAEVSPRAYLPKLCRALISAGHARELRDHPDAQLALYAEAVAVARRIGADDPNRTEILVRALSAHQRQLYEAGRRAEGFALCEEMARVGRQGFEAGQVQSPLYGHGRLAVVLAEEGRHREAAEICGRFTRAGGAKEPDRGSFWDAIEWAAELDAAGDHGAALNAFAGIVATAREECAAGNGPPAILVWELVRHSQMLDAAGRRDEATAARQEALGLLAELDETGERRSWSNVLSWWTVLLALSGRELEPPASPDSPAPSFGSTSWSGDTARAYFDALPALEERAARLAGEADTDPRTHLPELIAVHRRATIRAALLRERRSHIVLEPLRPFFDRGVALARRLTELVGAEGRAALAGALTDRSMFLLAAERYGEAHEDFLAAAALLDPAPESREK
ncbi:hypothetical protein ACFYZN_17375 [Streptomyces sp. NPDC001777]|uniref:hypothetical protein n=1 Tax=Streptomyces sp. NPDC001777 TaxID=3364608 RepID=UPI003697C8DC